MNIYMFTNTYAPFVGGVPKSVQMFTEQYRKKGHRVIVVAPEFENQPEDEEDVIRIPSIQNFNGTDFSVKISALGMLSPMLEECEPDIVHSHHPFLLGVTALRVSRRFQVPLVFTHHTLYEQYTHYLPVNNPTVKTLVSEIAVHYGNLTDHVFAPGSSVADLLRDRGVKTPIDVLPTGVKINKFSGGNGKRFRNRFEIPQDKFLVGHLGRLAPEKNLPFLARAVCVFLKEEEQPHFLVVGEGSSRFEIKKIFARAGGAGRLHFTGVLEGQQLIDAYSAMDVFVFASKTETQGMVLVEAMAAGTPVVALEASGVRDILEDGKQGRILANEDEKEFARALSWIYNLDSKRRKKIKENALVRANEFSMETCAEKALDVYRSVCEKVDEVEKKDQSLWARSLRRIETEWEIITNMANITEKLFVKKNTES